ncbi:MAG: NADH-quinone oxidoreductase subunit NuoG [Zetaproteobacteria bacterium]|nr:NADH-quinone oxidoreductase subunit NuoG [Zetaproteobacteria bacterium]
MTSLFINEQEVTVEPGTSILEACQQNGVNVPYFCYHSELSVAANCRMCLVHVEGWNKAAASCCTPVSEGMKVVTENAALKKDREMVMEYLLIHHPLDCPVCDQGGACKLQDYTVRHGAKRGRYNEPKRAVVDHDLGPFVSTCMTRCIHCTRCVRFADEIAGTGDMGVLNRGDHMRIEGIVEDCLTSELSGNLADICPVGALLDKPSHDISRPWEVTRHRSTCTQCPHGCDIVIESRGDQVIRIKPDADGVEPWICDRGRYIYDAFRSEHRLLTPKQRGDEGLISATWDDAFSRANMLLKNKRVGIIFSPDWSVEGLAAIRLLRDAGLGDAKVAYDLHRKDLRPFSFEEGLSMTTQQVEEADQVVILGSDLRQRLPILMQRLRKRINNQKPVTRIGAMNYRTNATMSEDALIRPRDWHAVIATAMQQVMNLGKTAAGMDDWLARVSDRHDAGKLLADALIADSCALLVGEEIRSHGDAAALVFGLDLLMRACGHAEVGKDGRNLIPEGMNSQALSSIFGDIRCSMDELLRQASDGAIDTLLLVGSDPMGDGLFPVQAERVMGHVPLVQIGAIAGKMSEYADVILPVAAYSEVEGTFVNMEGRVRVADHPLKSIGTERPLWKVAIRLAKEMTGVYQVTTLDELRQKIAEYLPELTIQWSQKVRLDDRTRIVSLRNKSAKFYPAHSSPAHPLDIVSRYSMYREGRWARASALLSQAGRLHCLADVIVHPDTLSALKIGPGLHRIGTSDGEGDYQIAVREDVSPGVIFVAKRGAAGALSSYATAYIVGGL